MAILQESRLELLTQATGTANSTFEPSGNPVNIPADPHPIWRAISWSPDSKFIAISSSAGKVRDALHLINKLIIAYIS